MKLISKISEKILRESYKTLSKDYISGLQIQSVPSLKKIGSDYGGWIIPTNMITSTSICYCAGVGEDITFDLGLIENFGCVVHAYDPTPRSAAYIKENVFDSRYLYFEFGLWNKDEILKFYAPSDPDHVSHSVLNLQKTDTYFEAPCKRLKTLMAENNHSKIDLLKLDIEGSEYKVIDSIIEDKLDIKILCVEYDEAYQPLDKDYARRIKTSVAKLVEIGYVLVAADLKCNYTFVKQ